MTESASTTDLTRLADRFVEDYAASLPTVATYIGVPGHDDRWPDWSPEGREAHADLLRATLTALESVTPVDRREEIAHSAMVERLGAELARTDAGYALADLNTIDSPLQDVRSTFDLMPVATEDDWATIARRLAAVPEALARWTTGLDAAAARRAGLLGAASCGSAPASPAAGPARRAGPASSPSSWPARPSRPTGRWAATSAAAADDVAAALQRLADHLEQELLPPGAAGRRRRPGALRRRGAVLHRRRPRPGGDLRLGLGGAGPHRGGEGGRRRARSRPGRAWPPPWPRWTPTRDRMVRGREALQAWLQDTADAAISALDGVHFDIPGPVPPDRGTADPDLRGGRATTAAPPRTSAGRAGCGGRCPRASPT